VSNQQLGEQADALRRDPAKLAAFERLAEARLFATFGDELIVLLGNGGASRQRLVILLQREARLRPWSHLAGPPIIPAAT
jgi:hypothetical protein